MNETPAATPRVHAGCGHLCLTCGAQAAVRAVTIDVVINVCIIVSLAVATLLASVLITHVIDLAVQEYTARQKPVPPPMVGQSLSYAGETITPVIHTVASENVTVQLNADGGMLTTYSLVADGKGTASLVVAPEKTCMCSRGDGYCSVSRGLVTVVGVRPGSVIHVGCW